MNHDDELQLYRAVSEARALCADGIPLDEAAERAALIFHVPRSMVARYAGPAIDAALEARRAVS